MSLERKMFSVVESLRTQARSKARTLRGEKGLAKWKKETLRWAVRAHWNAADEIVDAIKQHRSAERQARFLCKAKGKALRQFKNKR